MRPNRYTAVIDTCSLAGALPRNMLLTLAEAGFFRPRWSAETMEETEQAIVRILSDRGDPGAQEKGRRSREAMERAFPEAVVTGHTDLIPGLTLPDRNDRHVLAAAIYARAAVVVTDNLRHFPPGSVAGYEIDVSSTDQFLADVIDLDVPAAVSAFRGMRLRFRRPEFDAEALLTRMEAAGLTTTANLLMPERSSL